MGEQTCHGGIHLGHKVSIQALLGCEDMPQHTSTGERERNGKERSWLENNEVLLRLDQGGGRNLLAMLGSASKKSQGKLVPTGSRWWAKWRDLAVEKSVTGHDEGQIKQTALPRVRQVKLDCRSTEGARAKTDGAKTWDGSSARRDEITNSVGVYDGKGHETLDRRNILTS